MPSEGLNNMQIQHYNMNCLKVAKKMFPCKFNIYANMHLAHSHKNCAELRHKG